ncbi:MAG TPA: glycosyltransferase, partial [Candidatus Poseidoniaceae archaeon]
MAEAFNPKVASVIPVLNEAESIIGCLNSLCNQSYPANQHQIHVLDGGSTDNSWHLIETFINDRKEKQPAVYLHKNPGKYVAEARNLALELIPKSVEYFVEIIGHCSVESDHIEKLVSTMGVLQKSTNNNVGALGARVVPRQGEL